MSTLNFTRPTRGAVRLDDYSWDVDSIRCELEQIAALNWKDRKQGTNWSDLALFVRGEGDETNEHPILNEAPTLKAVLHGFPAKPVDMCLASLRPGGFVKEHRDISGGTAANVIRLHIPIITHPDVSFFVSGERVFMSAGEVWHLDTTYRHRVENKSDIERIHLILDLESTPELRRLLPEADYRDRLHTIAFAFICIGKGMSLIAREPSMFLRKCRDFIKLRVEKQSVLYSKEDLQ